MNSPGAAPDPKEASDTSVDAAARLIRRAWASDGRRPPFDSGLVEQILSSEAGFDFGSAALVPAEAVAIGVLGERNGALYGDADFAAAFPDPAGAPDLRRLAERARRTGAAVGLLETAQGALACAWLGQGAAARRWARTPAALAAMDRPGAVLALVFAPSRSGELAARVSVAFGLTAIEARLAEAFLFAPTLEIAAAQAGIGHATARDVLARVMVKTGAARSAEVVGRLAEVMSATHEAPKADTALLQEAFGLTPAEGGVALQLAAGVTQREAAARLGLRPETVRGYAKAVLAKTGAARAKDLSRLVAETRALCGLVAVAEPVFTSEGLAGHLRLMPRPDGRRLAFLDYGPPGGLPAVVFHGFTAGRSLPPALAAGLQRRGLRPIVPQRPGFGLTSPAQGPYLNTAADDLAALVTALGAERIHLFARDGGAAAALAFSAAYPERIARGVLLNPRAPDGLSPGHRNRPVRRMTRQILEQPQVITALGEFIRRRTRSDFLDTALDQMLGGIAPDRDALRDPAVRAQLIRDIQAQFAHTSAGYAAEQAVYARGWRLPVAPGGKGWAIAWSAALMAAPTLAPWSALPGVTFHSLAGAGVLAQFTHAEVLSDLIAASPEV